MSRYRDRAFLRGRLCVLVHTCARSRNAVFGPSASSRRHRRRSIADLSAWRIAGEIPLRYELAAGSGISSRVLGIQFDEEAARFYNRF